MKKEKSKTKSEIPLQKSRQKKKTLEQLKSELDEHTYLEIKHFPNSIKSPKPIALDQELVCGSLYDTIDPKPGISVKENKRHKRNKTQLSQVKGKWVRKEYLDKFSGQRIYGDIDELHVKSGHENTASDGMNSALPLSASQLDKEAIDVIDSDMSSILDGKVSQFGSMRIKKKALEQLYNPDVDILKSLIKKPGGRVESVVDEF